MEYLLIGGAQSVGKSECIYRLAKHLISQQGFIDIYNLTPTVFQDFRAILERTDSKGVKIRIIINSPTDNIDLITEFKDFYNTNGNYDILISSIRDNDFWPRYDFFRLMEINTNIHKIIEIPLAKVTRRGANFNVALNWYQDKIDNLILHTLKNKPFLI